MPCRKVTGDEFRLAPADLSPELHFLNDDYLDMAPAWVLLSETKAFDWDQACLVQSNAPTDGTEPDRQYVTNRAKLRPGFFLTEVPLRQEVPALLELLAKIEATVEAPPEDIRLVLFFT